MRKIMQLRESSIVVKSARLRCENGSALIIALVMLLLMTLIGITAMQTTVMQERMAGNIRDRNIAFEAAEGALRVGEAMAMDATTGPYNGTGGLYDDEFAPAPSWQDDASWADGASVPYPGVWVGAGNVPRFRLERLAPISSGSLEVPPELEPGFIRVTARGSGGSDDAVVILESLVRP